MVIDGTKPVAAPPPEVLRAFGASAAPELLPGGQGTTYRAGELVLKPATTAAEAQWVAEVFSSLTGLGFRVPRPVRASSGEWLAGGWCAWERIEGETAGPNGGCWPETLAACEAFHRALAHLPRPPFLDERVDPWAVADRMAWGERPLELLPEFAPAGTRLAALLTPLELPFQMVHGDFTANILFAEGLPPAVIDFSPYWRPAGFAAAVIAVDALTWADLHPRDLALFARLPGFEQLLVRAALRRFLEFDRHTRARRRPTFAIELAAHTRTIGFVERFLAN